MLDPRAGSPRDVVRDHRDGHGVGHPSEVLEQSSLRRLVVVRRDEQQPVGAELLGLSRQLERLRGVVRSGAAQDLTVALRDADDGLEQIELLPVRQGRRLARRPGDHQGVGTSLVQVRSERSRRVHVERVIVAEGCDHGGDDRPKPTGHDASSLRCGVFHGPHDNHICHMLHMSTKGVGRVSSNVLQGGRGIARASGISCGSCSGLRPVRSQPAVRATCRRYPSQHAAHLHQDRG